MKLRIFAVFLVVFSLYQNMALAGTNQTTPAGNAVLIDVNTDTILLDKKSSEQMPTSSMSKVMTMYMVFDGLKNGTLKLTDKFLVSEKAWKKGGSKMFVQLGKRIKLEDLIKGVIVQSGNDATIVIAEGISGDEDVFARLMTERAKEIGMKNSNFTNASGWPDKNHYSTAKDLAVLAYRMIKDFPEYYHYYSMKEFTYNKINQPNRNLLLYKNIGVDGLKTGHTEIGGYGMISSAKRDGRRLILVVNGLSSEKERAAESSRLLEWGFRNFKNMTLFKKGEHIEEIDTWLGMKSTVSIVPAKDINMLIPIDKKKDIKVTIEYETPIAAPIKKGDVLGKLKILIPEVGIKEFDLVAGEDVLSLGFVKKTLTKMKHFALERL